MPPCSMAERGFQARIAMYLVSLFQVLEVRPFDAARVWRKHRSTTSLERPTISNSCAAR